MKNRNKISFLLLSNFAVIFLLISSNVMAQKATEAEMRKQSVKNWGQNLQILNLALVNEESRAAFKTCVNNTDNTIREQISAAKAQREATFRKSEKAEYTAAINQLEFRTALHLDSLSSCHARWLMILAHYDFPTVEMADIREATPNKIPDAALQSIIDDYDENFYVVMSSYFLSPTPDEFLASGPWAATDEDFRNMYDSVASGIGLTETMKRQAEQQALETQRFLNNTASVARATLFNSMLSEDNGVASLWTAVVTNLVDGPSPRREGVLELTGNDDIMTDWFMKEATLFQSYLGCEQMPKEKNAQLVELVNTPEIDWNISSSDWSVCEI